MIATAVALSLWGASYIFVARPDASAGLGDKRPPETLRGAQGQGSTAAADGKQIFTQRCQACHQANGEGLPGVFPPLAKSEWATAAAEIPAQILVHGLTGPVQVAGNSYNGTMPTFGDQMKDDEIAAVLTYVRSSWSNSAPPLAPDTVAKARSSVDRKSPWTAEELRAQVK
jgi:mono/diheme cytochrome c family protein